MGDLMGAVLQHQACVQVEQRPLATSREPALLSAPGHVTVVNLSAVNQGRR